jgi:hypothetical protein
VERSILRYQDSIWNAISDYERTVILYINTVWFVLRATELFKIDIFRKHDLVLMTICFVFNNYFQKIVFQQKVTIKFIAQPLPEGAEGVRNMLVSLGLRCWQYTIVRGLHEQRITAEVNWLYKNCSYTRIQLRPVDAIIRFKLCRRRFSIKTAFAMAVTKAQR